MKNTLTLKCCVADFNTLIGKEINNKDAELMIYSDIGNLLDYTRDKEPLDGGLFSLWVTINKSNLMFDLELDELELFANSLLKHIEILKREHSKQIELQRKLKHDI